MSSVAFRIEVYHHGSNTASDYSYGCPQFSLMGYTDLDELFWDCYREEQRRQKLKAQDKKEGEA